MDSRTNISDHSSTSQQDNLTSPKDASPTPHTIVVALDILRDDPLFSTFKALSVEKKIDLLVDRIVTAYQLVSTKAMHADYVIVACREYTITGENDARTISAAESKLLKAKMAELTNKYPKLLIAVGGVGIHKYINAAQVENIRNHYKHPYNQQLIQEEQKFGKESALTLLGDYYHRLNNTFISEHASYRKIKNTSYLFFQDKIGRHAKAAPFYECQPYSVPTSTNAVMNENIYQPAKGRNLPAVIPISHKLSLGLTICREDIYATHHAMLSSTDGSCRIDFLFSDFIDFNTTHRKQHPTIHLDSSRKARLVLPPHVTEASHITLYRLNFLGQDLTLEGPVKAIYPLQYALHQCANDILNAADIKFYDESMLKPQIASFIQKIDKLLGTEPETSLGRYDDVIDALILLADNYKNLSKPMNIHARHCYFLYVVTTKLLQCTLAHIKTYHPEYESQLRMYHPNLVQHLKHAQAYMPAYEHIEVVSHSFKAKF